LAAQVHTIRLEWAPTVASEFEATGGDKYTWGLHRDGHFHPVRFSRLFT
jgi:hypothetical protein